MPNLHPEQWNVLVKKWHMPLHGNEADVILISWPFGTTMPSVFSCFLVQSALLGWFRGLLFAKALMQ